ncbi:MAG: TonB-dependent receptor, partial [Dyella sp.]|nr:TonB-dependent receptor [Dyella sp.]
EGGFGVSDITVGNIFHPVYSPKVDIAAPAKNQTHNEQPSAFVSDLINIGEQWSAMLGLRHVHYTSRSYPASGGSSRYSTDTDMPSAGLVYKPLANLSAYVSYAEGFEQGGVAPYNTLNAGQYLSPIKSKQYETGIKADVSDALTLNAALFRIEKTLQYVNDANYYVQGGTQRHTGVELTANGRLTSNLSLLAGAAWLDTEQLDTGDATTDGKRAANVPRFQANAFLDYRIAAVPGLGVNAGAYYVGTRPLNAQNSATLPGYVRVDAGASYQTQLGSHRTVWRAGVQNLTDRRYWAAANYSSVWPGLPRTLSLSVQFDI